MATRLTTSPRPSLISRDRPRSLSDSWLNQQPHGCSQREGQFTRLCGTDPHQGGAMTHQAKLFAGIAQIHQKRKNAKCQQKLGRRGKLPTCWAAMVFYSLDGRKNLIECARTITDVYQEAAWRLLAGRTVDRSISKRTIDLPESSGLFPVVLA